MDSERFDQLVAAAARRPSRRSTLRLLAGGLLGGFLALRGSAARAQRADRDDDGLFDDDETDVYGTNPDVFDTDGDGDSDGLEVYNGTDPLVNPNAAPPAPAGPACLGGEIVCNGVCVQPLFDRNNCGFCGKVCLAPGYCSEGLCLGISPAACPVGTYSCSGQCVDLNNDGYNCGVCGAVCGEGLSCVKGFCQGVAVCSPGKSNCNGVCVDLANDFNNCGRCGNSCYNGDPTAACIGRVCQVDF